MPESHMPSPLLSSEELAKFAGVPVNTVYAWQSRGNGPPAYRVGRHTRYRQDEVLAWLELKRRPLSLEVEELRA
jgi:excisionase family DNA binding protein